MRAFPVNPAAVAAAIKFTVIAPRQRLETGPDLFGIDAFNQPVTLQAALQRLDLPGKVESLHDFLQLGLGIVRTHPEAMANRLAKQQAPVARQDDALFANRDLDNFAVLEAITVSAVESEHAQQARELAQIDIDHESSDAQRFCAQVLQRRDIETFEQRIDSDTIAVPQAVIEPHRFVVHQDQVDFAMRHPQGFDRILDRGPAVKAVLDGFLVTLGREKIIEFFVKTKIGDVGFQAYNLLPWLQGFRQKDLRMFAIDSYRSFITSAVEALLIAASLILAVECANADDDFQARRENMIRLIENDVRATSAYLKRAALDERVLAAMASVPRHEFVPADLVGDAYRNRPLPIGHGQTISQPYIVAIMTDLLELEAGQKVLEIGTGSGYQAAVLAELDTRVWSIEIIEPLAKRADSLLRRLGYDRIELRVGDGYYGWAEQAPFDAIIVTAAASHIPPPLVKQLAIGGKMIIPVGSRFSTQELILITRIDSEDVVTRQVLPVRFVPLTGSH